MNVIVIVWVGSPFLSPEVIIARICRLSMDPGRPWECASVMRPLRLSLSAASLRTWWSNIKTFSLFSDICWLTVVTDTSSSVKSYQQGVWKPSLTWIFYPCVCFTSYLCLNSETIDCKKSCRIVVASEKWIKVTVSTLIATYHEALDMLGLGKSTYHHIWNNESRPLRALSSQGSSGLMMH